MSLSKRPARRDADQVFNGDGDKYDKQGYDEAVEHWLGAGAAQGFEVCVQADCGERGDHQKFADIFEDGCGGCRDQSKAGQAGHGEKREDEPGEDRFYADPDGSVFCLFFFLQMHTDAGEDQDGRDDCQRTGQLDHGGKVTCGFAEGVSGSNNAGGVVDRSAGPKAECSVGQAEKTAKDREDDDHNSVKQEGGGQSVGNVHVGCFNDRGNCGNGGTAADSGSRVDQAACFPVETEGFANQRAETKAGCKRKQHDCQRKFADGQNGADIQAGSEQDDGKFQNFLGCKFDSGRGFGGRLLEGMNQHAEEHGNDRRTDQMQTGRFLQSFKKFGGCGDNQGKRRARKQFSDSFHKK